MPVTEWVKLGFSCWLFPALQCGFCPHFFRADVWERTTEQLFVSLHSHNPLEKVAERKVSHRVPNLKIKLWITLAKHVPCKHQSLASCPEGPKATQVNPASHPDTGEDILASSCNVLRHKNKSLCAIYWQQINLELLEIIDFSIQMLMGMLLSLSTWAVGSVMSCPEILAIPWKRITVHAGCLLILSFLASSPFLS